MVGVKGQRLAAIEAVFFFEEQHGELFAKIGDNFVVGQRVDLFGIGDLRG